MKPELTFLLLILSLVTLMQVISASEIQPSVLPNGSGIQNPVFKHEWIQTGSDNWSVIFHPVMRMSDTDLINWYNTRYIHNDIAPDSPYIRSEPKMKTLLPYIRYVPNERNQGQNRDSWVWASTTPIEIDLRIKKEISDRLSIQYFNSRYHNGGKFPFESKDFAGNGGWPELFTEFYTYAGQFGGNNMVVPWSNLNASYQDGIGYETSLIPADSVGTNPHYLLSSLQVRTVRTAGVNTSQAIENIRYQIDNNRAVILLFSFPNQNTWNHFFRFWNQSSEETDYIRLDQFSNLPYDLQNGAGIHAVVITGYDDHGDHGYWQCLNSWGTNENHPQGIFYIDMNMNYSARYQNNIPVVNFETISAEFAPEPANQGSDMILRISPGWNLISTPENLSEGNNTYEIFHRIQSRGHSIYGFDSDTGWKRYNRSDFFDPHEGVWIFSDTDAEIPLFFTKNSPNTSSSWTANKGWNLIGAPLSSGSVNETFRSIGSQWKVLIPYNTTTQYYDNPIVNGWSGVYSDQYEFSPGKGYWLLMTENGTISHIRRSPESLISGTVDYHIEEQGWKITLPGTISGSLSPDTGELLIRSNDAKIRYGGKEYPVTMDVNAKVQTFNYNP